MKNITISAELTEAQAEVFAQFLKRAGLDDFRRLAASDQEARDMQEAGQKLRESLRDAGYNPR